MIAAVVLAAGESRRMGRPKMSLAWGESTVIGCVVTTLYEAGVEQVVVVSGGAAAEVEAALRLLPEERRPTIVHNPQFDNDDMGLSLQTGLNVLGPAVEAALVVLGDQPQREVEVVKALISEYFFEKKPLVLPSYQMRRGHPWLVGRSLWGELLDLRLPATLRDFVNLHAGEIDYVPVDTGSILQDLDTPEDYKKARSTDLQ